MNWYKRSAKEDFFKRYLSVAFKNFGPSVFLSALAIFGAEKLYYVIKNKMATPEEIVSKIQYDQKELTENDRIPFGDKK